MKNKSVTKILPINPCAVNFLMCTKSKMLKTNRTINTDVPIASKIFNIIFTPH